jgi:general secretion pathway protein M
MALALPEGPRGRALALAMTAIALALVWLGVAQPVLDSYAESADELERRAALAQRMSDLAASLPELQRAAQSQTTEAAPAAATLEGTSDAVAAASLQGLLEGMANSVSAHITSAEALPAEQVGAYRRISLRLTVGATWPVLIRMLQLVDRATPRMFIDELQIHAQPAAEKLREPPLDISLVVLSFRSAAADPKGTGPGPLSGGAAQ